MEVGYKEALDQLQAMFQDCDENTIKSVLRANQGHMEKTIEDLLKMSAEAENDDNDDNLFAETNPRPKQRANRNDDLFGIEDESRGNRFEDLGIFGENQSRPKNNGPNREQQEKADAELAYRLQKEEIAHEKEMERQEAIASRGGSRNNNAAGWNFSQSNPQQSNPPQSNQYSNQAPESGEKKKSGIVSKVKAGISSVFGKKKKKGPTQNPGQYAEIDNLDDQQEIYNFNGGGSQSTGLHQFQGNKQNDDYDDAPMQLSDILNPRGMSNMKNNDSDEEDNNYENGNGNGNGNGNRNRNNQGVDNDHFGFH